MFLLQLKNISLYDIPGNVCKAEIQGIIHTCASQTEVYVKRSAIVCMACSLTEWRCINEEIMGEPNRVQSHCVGII
jgi:hypothetical protein